MFFKKKVNIITIFFVIFIQVLLHINNSQKTSFRYFVWKIDELSLGKLMNISFVTGLVASIILHKSNNGSFLKFKEKNNYEKELSYEEKENNEDDNLINDIPPQRDVRDIQPTISVNYRVIKNKEENFNDYQREESMKNPSYKDDWENEESDW